MPCKNVSGKCSSSGNGKNFRSLKDIVDDFCSWSPHKKDEHNHIKKRSLPLTGKDIEEAASCIDYRGVMSLHQRRVSHKKLDIAGKLLKGVKAKINKSGNFAELHKVVERSFSAEKGLGILAVYDISVRLGKMKGLSPKKVYLHCGTLEGARMILGKTTKKGVYPIKDFPSELHKLTADQIETLLCVYKGDLKKLKDDGKI